MAKKSSFLKNWPKWLLQLGTLALIVILVLCLVDPEKYCPMGGLQALTTYLVNESLPCSMTTLQILMGVALAAAVIVLSKLFCGYLCPVGTVEDLLSKARKALKVKSVRIKTGSVPDKVLRIVKYCLLFWIFYMTATSSELFCKNLDPYYATATGFKGEITLWMSIITVSIVIILGFFIDRFWCKYVCPLGAVSNTLKFWGWVLLLVAVYVVFGLVGVKISWVALLATACILGYVLEILGGGRTRLQAMYVRKDDDACTGCGLCSKNCPYSIDIKNFQGRVNSVDCTLCGECVAACNTGALSLGKPAGDGGRNFRRFIPAIASVVLVIAAILIGRSFELPTIDVQWGVEEGMDLETVKIENLKTVKCYGSSMAFKARMENVRGVHGVKTYVGSHTVVISYDPKATNEDKIKEEVFEPSHFRVWSPDPAKIQELKRITIRTENMYDKLDLNYLGLQFRNTGKSIFGVDSEYDCPLIVHVYMSPDEQLDEEWFREIVNKKSLDMPVHGGGVKSTPVDFEFVKLEKGETSIGIDEYLHMMFDPYTAEVNGRYTDENGETYVEKRAKHYEGQTQYMFEIAEQNYEKPIIKRALPYLSNHLSREEGIIGLYLRLNKDLVPAIMVRFAPPMTAERVRELMDMETWTITYSQDDVREEGRRMEFPEGGTVYEFTEVPE